MIKDWFAAFGDAVGARLTPLIETRLDRVETKVDEWVDEARTDLVAKLPEMAAAVAERAVQTVFDNTKIDEAADDAIDIVTGFFEHFRDGLGGLGR